MMLLLLLSRAPRAGHSGQGTPREDKAPQGAAENGKSVFGAWHRSGVGKGTLLDTPSFLSLPSPGIPARIWVWTRVEAPGQTAGCRDRLGEVG